MAAARVSCGWLLSCVLLPAVILSVNAQTSDAACSKGDQACFCKSIGGTWKALQSPLLPACKVTYDHQGQERYVHVYLPKDYDGTTQWPVWVHLHGVFWATMGDIGARVGKPVNGTDIIPAFDHSVEILGDKAILVYPQSTGEAGNGTPDEGQGKKYRQFWKIPFWRCSVGICRDASIDDMGFIEKVVSDMPKRLPLKPGHYLLSGESAGGMMVHAILCESKVIPGLVNAAIDMLGGIGADYARGPECASSTPVPFLKLHGVEDPFITYSKDILVDGVNFASSIEGTQLRARANGCGPDDAGKKDVPEADGKMLCTDYCGGAAGKLPAKLCGMPGVGHDTDHPHPGFVYEQSWAWFQEQTKRNAGSNQLLPAKKNATAKVNTTKAAQGASALEPLVLNITYPGAAVEDFKGAKGAAALDAVSTATGLPAANITATYHQAAASRSSSSSSSSSSSKDASSSTSSSKGGNRRLLQHMAAHWRHLLAAAAAGEGGSVVGSYALKAAEPSKVAESVSTAVSDGSLLKALQKQGLASAAADKGPLVTLVSNAAGAEGSQETLVKVTDLVKAAGVATKQPSSKSDTDEADSSSSADSKAPAAAPATEKPQAKATPADLKTPAESLYWMDKASDSSSSSGGSSSSSGQQSTGLIVGAVLGALGGAALLAAGVFWAMSAARQRKQQQYQQQHQQPLVLEEQGGKVWEQQQQRPNVINLNADAVMQISDELTYAK